MKILSQNKSEVVTLLKETISEIKVLSIKDKYVYANELEVLIDVLEEQGYIASVLSSVTLMKYKMENLAINTDKVEEHLSNIATLLLEEEIEEHKVEVDLSLPYTKGGIFTIVSAKKLGLATDYFSDLTSKHMPAVYTNVDKDIFKNNSPMKLKEDFSIKTIYTQIEKLVKGDNVFIITLNKIPPVSKKYNIESLKELCLKHNINIILITSDDIGLDEMETCDNHIVLEHDYKNNPMGERKLVVRKNRDGNLKEVCFYDINVRKFVTL